MENKFVIMCRYETFTLSGKKFNDWFVYDSKPRTEQEGNDYIKTLKKNFEYIDTKTKLKHEYKLASYSEYSDKMKALQDNLTVLDNAHKEYLKSDEYKELKKKKNEARKELKERQKKYIEEHTKNDN